MAVLLFPDLDCVTIRALHQAIGHFDDIDPGTERGIDGGHFQTNDAAADDQHLLRYKAQFQRPGRIHNARITRDERQMYGGRAGGDDAFLELDHLLAAGLVLAAAVGDFHLDMVGIEEVAVTAHDLDLAALGHAGQAAGQFADDLFLVRAQLVDIDLRCGEADAQIIGVLGFFNDLGNVQQGLGGNAADVQTNAAERCITLDDDRLHPQVCRAEGGGITAGACAKHQHFAFKISTAAMAARSGGGQRCSRRGHSGLRCRRGGCRTRFHLDQQGTFADAGAQLNQDFLDRTGDRGRHIHRCLVGLQGDDGFIDLDRVADLHKQVDHRHVGEIANIRDFDFNETHAHLPLQRDTAEVGQQLGDIDVEAGCQCAVDDAVVSGQRQRQGQARGKLLAVPDRLHR